MQSAELDPYNKFRSYASILLGTLTGMLISIPLSGVRPESPGAVVALGAALGTAIGYRRRKSPAFFYFALVCICILSTLIIFSMGGGQSK